MARKKQVDGERESVKAPKEITIVGEVENKEQILAALAEQYPNTFDTFHVLAASARSVLLHGDVYGIKRVQLK